MRNNENVFAKTNEPNSIYDSVCSVCKYNGECVKLNYNDRTKCDLQRELMAVIISAHSKIPLEITRNKVNSL